MQVTIEQIANRLSSAPVEHTEADGIEEEIARISEEVKSCAPIEREYRDKLVTHVKDMKRRLDMAKQLMQYLDKSSFDFMGQTRDVKTDDGTFLRIPHFMVFCATSNETTFQGGRYSFNGGTSRFGFASSEMRMFRIEHNIPEPWEPRDFPNAIAENIAPVKHEKRMRRQRIAESKAAKGGFFNWLFPESEPRKSRDASSFDESEAYFSLMLYGYSFKFPFALDQKSRDLIAGSQANGYHVLFICESPVPTIVPNVDPIVLAYFPDGRLAYLHHFNATPTEELIVERMKRGV